MKTTNKENTVLPATTDTIVDAIEHDTQLRDALTLLIDSSLVKYGLQTEEEVKHFKRKTLFDREPPKKNVIKDVVINDSVYNLKENK